MRLHFRWGVLYAQLGGRFGYFLFSLARGGEEGGAQGAREGAGGRLFIENPRRGAKFFFSGPKFPPRVFLKCENSIKTYY